MEYAFHFFSPRFLAYFAIIHNWNKSIIIYELNFELNSSQFSIHSIDIYVFFHNIIQHYGVSAFIVGILRRVKVFSNILCRTSTYCLNPIRSARSTWLNLFRIVPNQNCLMITKFIGNPNLIEYINTIDNNHSSIRKHGEAQPLNKCVCTRIQLHYCLLHAILILWKLLASSQPPIVDYVLCISLCFTSLSFLIYLMCSNKLGDH